MSVYNVFLAQSQLLGLLHAARAPAASSGAFKATPSRPVDRRRLRALSRSNPPQDEDFHDLVAERHERASTIVTSNLEFSEWGQAFTNQLLGAGTLDRLPAGAYRVTLEGESYRKPRPLPKTTSRSKVAYGT